MESEKILQNTQTVSIIDRKKIELNGAKEVLTSTEKEILVKLDDCFMKITGENLTILKLVPEEKILIANGVINGINYMPKLLKKSFFKKVFK